MLSGLAIAGIVLGSLVLIIILYVIYIYNSLIRLNMQTNNAWSQIDVQLKRRYDLIPNLIKTVKGYMKHERETLESITKSRAALMKGSTAERAKANNQITEALKTIFAVAENYPNLKANENFKMLQEELAGTENKIAYARQFYNDSVQSFNIRIQLFPGNVFARSFGYKKRDFFKTDGKEREVVKVEF